MYQATPKTTLPIFLVLALLIAPLAVAVTFAAPTVSVAKSDYKPGETLSASGTATANALVSLQVFDPNGKRKAIAQAKADAGGAWSADNIYVFTDADATGTWTLKAFEGGVSAEASFTLSALPVADTTPPTLTVKVQPVKTMYKAETITILVMGDEDLGKASITVTQAGASSITLTDVSAAIGDASKWGGTYKITSGYDGKASVAVTAEDLAGNSATAKASFTVDTVAPKVTIVAPASTDSATITVKGTVDDPVITEVTITIPPLSPLTATVKSDLTFETTVTLPATGSNTITVQATDIAGNVGKASAITVYRGPLEVLVEDVQGVKTTLNNIQSSINDLKTGQNEIKNSISEVKSSIGEVKSSISTVKTSVDDAKSTLSKAVSAVDASVAGLSTLVIVAVALSLVAAVAAIVAVVTIARKVVLK